MLRPQRAGEGGIWYHKKVLKKDVNILGGGGVVALEVSIFLS